MTQSEYVGEQPPDDGHEWIETTTVGDPARRWVRGEPKATSERRARNRATLDSIKRIFGTMIEQLEQGIEDDTIDTLECRAEIDEIELEPSADGWARFAPGPNRKVIVNWESAR